VRKGKANEFVKGIRRYARSIERFHNLLNNLWGMLASISVFFPLSNIFAKLIPIDAWDQGGGLVAISPQVFTAIASLGAVFVVFFRFGLREKLNTKEGRQSMWNLTPPSFFGGLIALVIYLVLYSSIQNNLYATMG
jgi:hypothetical protein